MGRTDAVTCERREVAIQRFLVPSWISERRSTSMAEPDTLRYAKLSGDHGDLHRVDRRQRQMCIRDSMSDLLRQMKGYRLTTAEILYHRPDHPVPVSYTHLRAHETRHDLVCRLLLE